MSKTYAVSNKWERVFDNPLNKYKCYHIVLIVIWFTDQYEYKISFSSKFSRKRAYALKFQEKNKDIFTESKTSNAARATIVKNTVFI